MLTFQTSNVKDVEKDEKLIDQEAVSFSTLIKVGVIEKTEDLNFLVPKLDSSANSCSVENNAKNLAVLQFSRIAPTVVLHWSVTMLMTMSL